MLELSFCQFDIELRKQVTLAVVFLIASLESWLR